MKKSIWILIITIFLFSVSFAQNQKVWHRLSIFPLVKLSTWLSSIDYTKLSDDSIHKFVWVNKPFNNVNYEPSDLVSLQWRSHISAQAKHTLRKEAADNLEKMANDFFSEFWKSGIEKTDQYKLCCCKKTRKIVIKTLKENIRSKCCVVLML